MSTTVVPGILPCGLNPGPSADGTLETLLETRETGAVLRFRGRSPQGPVVLLMLIVARRCVKQCSRRFTHFAASAVSRAVVWTAKSRSIRGSCLDRRSHTHE